MQRPYFQIRSRENLGNTIELSSAVTSKQARTKCQIQKCQLSLYHYLTCQAQPVQTVGAHYRLFTHILFLMALVLSMH